MKFLFSLFTLAILFSSTFSSTAQAQPTNIQYQDVANFIYDARATYSIITGVANDLFLKSEFGGATKYIDLKKTINGNFVVSNNNDGLVVYAYTNRKGNHSVISKWSSQNKIWTNLPHDHTCPLTGPLFSFTQYGQTYLIATDFYNDLVARSEASPWQTKTKDVTKIIQFFKTDEANIYLVCNNDLNGTIIYNLLTEKEILRIANSTNVSIESTSGNPDFSIRAVFNNNWTYERTLSSDWKFVGTDPIEELKAGASFSIDQFKNKNSVLKSTRKGVTTSYDMGLVDTQIKMVRQGDVLHFFGVHQGTLYYRKTHESWRAIDIADITFSEKDTKNIASLKLGTDGLFEIELDLNHHRNWQSLKKKRFKNSLKWSTPITTLKIVFNAANFKYSEKSK